MSMNASSLLRRRTTKKLLSTLKEDEVKAESQEQEESWFTKSQTLPDIDTHIYIKDCIKTRTGHRIDLKRLSVELSDTVLKVKESLQRNYHIPIEYQKLTFRGELLEDYAILKYHSIKNGGTVSLNLNSHIPQRDMVANDRKFRKWVTKFTRVVKDLMIKINSGGGSVPDLLWDLHTRSWVKPESSKGASAAWISEETGKRFGSNWHRRMVDMVLYTDVEIVDMRARQQCWDTWSTAAQSAWSESVKTLRAGQNLIAELGGKRAISWDMRQSTLSKGSSSSIGTLTRESSGTSTGETPTKELPLAEKRPLRRSATSKRRPPHSKAPMAPMNNNAPRMRVFSASFRGLQSMDSLPTEVRSLSRGNSWLSFTSRRSSISSQG
mmetsp:Transcript_6815/g.9395  ORF Transcript_6815/g.9395 Transcript_6815/m.9395 type:complete len:380 (+) Transcript_6815:158-1297(+)|eukprot:CAMPEP_0184477926 /NCGR_PEP_ID=MMETSP0113_2-20130426/65_1 /TAXON_ID=91329 /ORGANISM="Norrisiella sphaerica, Strain BC52" /LENGTH=379 /DNA_ID=CAMNT_0026855535 /DNA_START=158 /DNA_END=1297 /DNA_ORIENTATION=+